MPEEATGGGVASEGRGTSSGASIETATNPVDVRIASTPLESARRRPLLFKGLEKTCRDWLTIVLLAASAGFTGWQAYLFRTSVSDARKASEEQQRNTVAALDIARRQSEALVASAYASQRAAKATEDEATSSRARLSLTLNVNKTRQGELKINPFQYANVDITITNRGQTEALITSYHTKLLLDAQSHAFGAEPGSFIDIDPTAIPPGTPMAAYVWLPDYDVLERGISELLPLPDEYDPLHTNVSTSIHIIKAGESPELYEQYQFVNRPAIRNPLDDSFLWVYVTYKDIFDVEGKTSIYVSLRTGEISTHHPEYNCADDNCPDTLNHLDVNPR